MRIPMPSPAGTNYARRYLDWPVASKMAMDAAPRSRRARDEDMPIGDPELSAANIEALGEYLLKCGIDRDDVAAITARLGRYVETASAGEDDYDPDEIERAGLARPVSERALGGDRRGSRRAMDAALDRRAADRESFARRFPDAARIKVA